MAVFVIECIHVKFDSQMIKLVLFNLPFEND